MRFLLAEEISKRGLRDKLDLRKGVIGSERWGERCATASKTSSALRFSTSMA